MQEKLTCGRCDSVLDEIGWMRFNCTKCGNDYSIGRKMVIEDPIQIINRKVPEQKLD